MDRENTDERLNPCVKEQKLSYKCLNENDYDKERCQLFFDNYNACKMFWNHVSKDRRRKGLKPALPWPLSERERIKREYVAKLNI